jgi:hypothetical protein
VQHAYACLAAQVSQIEAVLQRVQQAASAGLVEPRLARSLAQGAQAVTTFSKGFSGREGPQLRALFGAALALVLRGMELAPRSDELRQAGLSLAHRSIELLGSEAVPPLRALIEGQLATGHSLGTRDLAELVKLMPQLLTRLKPDAAPALQPLLAPLLARSAGHLQAARGGGGGGGAGSEEAREAAELLRAQQAFLQALLSGPCASLLLAGPGAPSVTALLEQAVAGALERESATQKVSVAVLGRLMRLLAQSPGEPLLLALRDYLLPLLLTLCGARAGGAHRLDLDDPNAFLTLQDLLRALRESVSRLPQPLAPEQLLNGLPISPELVPPFLHHTFVEQDARAVREFFRNLIAFYRVHVPPS